MARSADKKVAQNNATTLSNIRLAFLIANTLYIVVRIGLMYSSLTRSDVFWWAGVQVVSVAVYRQLESMATPTYGASGEIISGGEDLSASGLIGYMFDVIYIGLFVTVAVILSNRFWWTYALIPIYAGYKAFTSGMPMLQSLMGGMGAMTGGAEEAPGQQGRLKGKARKVR